MSVKVFDTRSPLKATSLNTIQSWFSEEAKTEAGVETLFHSQGWFHRCIDLRAKAIQNMPWEITRIGSKEPLWNFGAAELPDELQFAADLPRLLYLWEAGLVCVGQAYTLKESEGKKVDSLFYFNPMKVRPHKTEASGITHLKRQVNGREEVYKVDDVISLYLPDPFVEVGAGNNSAAKKNAQVLRALEGFLVNFLDKGLIKATILSVEGAENIQAEQKTNLRDAWRKSIAGWFNGGEQHIFNSRVTPHTIGEGLGDLNNNDLTKEQRQAVCAAVGIPFSLVMSNASNYATAELDHINFYTFTAIPQAKFIMRELNRQLFNAEGFTFTFMPERLEIMQRYELDKATKVTSVTGGPVLTRDEGRALLGYDPLPAGEVVGEQPVALVQDTVDIQENPVVEEKSIEEVVRRVMKEIAPKEVEATWAKEENTQEILSGRDVIAWKRKIKGKDRDVKFSPDHLSFYETAIIRQRLSDPEMSIEEVFKRPYAGF